MVCWVRRPTGSWEGVIPGSFRVCGLWVRAGLVPAFAHGRSPVGRKVREAGAGSPGPVGTVAVADVGWPCGAGRLGGAGRRGPARAVPPGHIGGGNNPGGAGPGGGRAPPPLPARGGQTRPPA